MLGQSPPLESFVPSSQRPIAQCSQNEPIPDMPQSQPIHEQGPNVKNIKNPWSDDQFPYWPDSAHKTGVAVSTSGTCGQPNLFEQGDCYLCGRSFVTIQEEITRNFLEQTHIDGVSYHTRRRRRNAFQAGMLAGSFILVHRECRRLPLVRRIDTKWRLVTRTYPLFPEYYPCDPGTARPVAYDV